MLKQLTKTDMIMLFLAFLSLIFAELSWFKGEKESATLTWLTALAGMAGMVVGAALVAPTPG